MLTRCNGPSCEDKASPGTTRLDSRHQVDGASVQSLNTTLRDKHRHRPYWGERDRGSRPRLRPEDQIRDFEYPGGSPNACETMDQREHVEPVDERFRQYS